MMGIGGHQREMFAAIVLTGLLLLAIWARGAATAVVWVPDLGNPQPGPGNQIVPLFQKPFEGNFLIDQYFDHNLPTRGCMDTNGYQLTYWNERLYERAVFHGQICDGHPGYDWWMPVGTPILAVADGQVTAVFGLTPEFCPKLNRVVSDLGINTVHTDPNGGSLVAAYGHLSQVDVQTGQRVSAGQRIGLSGIGCGTEGTAHLHFQVTKPERRGFFRIDPYGWVGANGVDPATRWREGGPSPWLWKEGQAPTLRRR